MPSFFDIFLGHFLVKPAQSYNAFNEKMLDVEEIWPYISVVRVSLASSSYNSWRQRTPQFIGEVNVAVPKAHFFLDIHSLISYIRKYENL